MRQVSYRWFAAILGLVASSASTAGAADFNTTLNTLVNNGTNSGGITLGDKRYSGFTFSSTGDAPVAASAVDVALVSSNNDNNYQLRFTFVRDPLDAPGGQTTDVVIGYRIDVLGPQLINNVGLAFAGTVTGADAAASVIETIRTTDGSDLSPGGATPSDNGVLSVFSDGTGQLPDVFNSSLAVNPTRSLLFEKDILVSARAGSGPVVITTVDNFVNQVPEPATAGLLFAGGAMLLARRRRA